MEAHILHRYAQDFYGCRLQVALLGFIRPEMKFSGLGELLSRIKADTALAQLQLSNCADMAPDRLPRDLFKV